MPCRMNRYEHHEGMGLAGEGIARKMGLSICVEKAGAKAKKIIRLPRGLRALTPITRERHMEAAYVREWGNTALLAPRL